MEKERLIHFISELDLTTESILLDANERAPKSEAEEVMCTPQRRRNKMVTKSEGAAGCRRR